MSDRVPRIDADELSPELAEFFAPRVKRLGYLGEFFQCMAHQPAALLSFAEFTEALKRALPSELTEIAALSVAVLLDNAYERVQHERLCEKLGFAPEWIKVLLTGIVDETGVLTLSEQAVQRFAIAMVKRNGSHTTPELNAVIDAIGVESAIAVLMLVARYMSHAVMVNALELDAPALAVARGSASREANRTSVADDGQVC